MLDPIAIERARRERDRVTPSNEAFETFERCLSELPAESARRVRDAWEFARGLTYHHAGLTTAAYLVHPLRVATMVMRAAGSTDVDAVVTALLHNVLEVTTVSRDEIVRRFGSRVAEAIGTLTVDRATQYQPAATRRYYDAIAAAGLGVETVKVMDKLDNLFLLHLNPDTEVTRKYLDEIEAEVVPMVRRAVPALAGYFAELVEDERRLIMAPAS